MPNACVPANAVPLPSLTRRSLLAGLTAAGTSLSVALAQTVSDADAELLALAAHIQSVDRELTRRRSAITIGASGAISTCGPSRPRF